MRMSDIVSGLDLAVFPQIAMVLFVGVFVAVSWRLLRNTQRDEHARAARLPLDDANDERLV